MARNDSNTLQHLFTWKIRNYCLCPYARNIALQSPLFKAHNINEKAIWCLKLYPRGCGYSSGGELASCFLARCDEDLGIGNIVCKYSIEIIDFRGEAAHSIEDRTLFPTGSSRGVLNFVNIMNLFKNAPDFLDQDLILKCHMKGKKANVRKISKNFAETKIGGDKIYFPWKIENISDHSMKKISFQLGSAEEYVMSFHMLKTFTTISITHVGIIDSFKKVLGKLSFVNILGEETELIRFEHLLENDRLTGHTTINNDLENTVSKFMRRGVLTLNCMVAASNDTIANSLQEYQYCPPICDNVPSDVNTVAAFFEDLRTLYKKIDHPDFHSDVVMIGKEHTESSNNIASRIYVHRAVLSARSRVLASRLEKSKELVFPSLKYTSLRKFVEYLYTGYIKEFDFDSASELQSVAKELEMEHLFIYCIKTKDKNLTTDKTIFSK